MQADRPRRATMFGRLAAGLLAVLAPLALPQQAASQSVGLRDSVPIGSNGLCEAQIQTPRPGQGLFDRSYQVVCRDAASAVGSLQVLGSGSFEAALAQATGADAQCRDGDSASLPQGLSEARSLVCTRPGNPVERLVLVGRSGGRIYAASGLAVYRDALRLGLTTLATDRQVAGTVEVPLTQAADPQAFARAQAEAISEQTALDEAYRRSNAGNFAEAAEFFTVSASTLTGRSATEAQLNAALQQSNLGNFTQARQLFAEAAPGTRTDPVLARLARNYAAIDALNRASPAGALLALDTPLPELSDSVEASLQLQIDNALSERLAAESGGAQVGGRLTVAERIALLDAQGTYLRASALRRQGDTASADAALRQAYGSILAVREGRVVSMLWLRAQILGELADQAESRGNIAEAEALHGEAGAMVERTYPASPALVTARGQLAGLYARTGRTAEATALYRTMVADSEGTPPASTRRLFAPYFRLLAEQGTQAAAADLFLASQLLQRPGLAQTQAVLARELSAGSDEAAQLFRQSINLTRAVEVLRGEQAQAADRAAQGVQGAATLLAEKTTALEQLRQRQLEVQQALAAYPRYRAVSDPAMTLASLQQALRPGEAYLKVVMLDESAYALMASPDGAQAWRLSVRPAEITAMVATLRDSIAVEEGGQTITYPFEIATARNLAKALFGPALDRLGDVRHLVFEPDGALLSLPANLLVMDDASVDRYLARIADPEADPYDFRGTAWLGRAMEVTTAVSPAAFASVRQARASDARGEYLGLGQNLPLVPGSTAAQVAGTRGGAAGPDAARCTWGSGTWNNPISAAELRTASSLLGGDSRSVEVLTGGEFTDSRLKAMDNLDEFRILHFATHGLVTAPQPGCPPRPALLTSFGDQDSDGLLTFGEIFDLSLDADLVILSACNTASTGGLAASREAGVTSGGDFALDGLVRAFVGAGGRTVVASHWPVPDDYNATGRLIAGFFQAQPGVAIGEALRQAQLALMNDAETSHPFYWSAFAVVGDGAAALRR
ncbi:CHAT domain-containing protein [Alteraurantiacibacter buctensis]|nr:CHAT domain-containing protein [Alteraurantiacibacter buctensis]